MKFSERIKKIQKETVVVLKKTQKKMKRQTDRRSKKVEIQKVEDKVMLSTKDLVFKKRPTNKLVNQYISPYIIERVVFTNIIKL